MANALAAALLTGAVTGAVAGGVVAGFLGAGGGPAEAGSRALDPNSKSQGQLVAMVDDLTEENDQLRRRVDALENAPRMAEGMTRVPVAHDDMPPSNEELLARIESLAAALGSTEPEAAVIPGFDQLVLGVMEREEEREDAERRQRDQERQLERNANRVEDLTEKLSLEGWQADEMLAILNERDTAMQSLRDELRESGQNWRDAGDLFGDMRESYDLKVQNVLSADQYTSYSESNNDRGFGFGGRGGGGRGGR